MHCDLNYGRGVLPVELGEELDVHVLRKPAMPVLHDPYDAVCEAFAKPINGMMRQPGTSFQPDPKKVVTALATSALSTVAKFGRICLTKGIK
jgi:hypothetical protein